MGQTKEASKPTKPKTASKRASVGADMAAGQKLKSNVGSIRLPLDTVNHVSEELAPLAHAIHSAKKPAQVGFVVPTEAPPQPKLVHNICAAKNCLESVSPMHQEEPHSLLQGGIPTELWDTAPAPDEHWEKFIVRGFVAVTVLALAGTLWLIFGR